MSDWTKQNIEEILKQLNSQNLPFSKYEFMMQDGHLLQLGKGASAKVFRAQSRNKKQKGYAIKVIGFNEKHIDSQEFKKIVEAQKSIENLHKTVIKIYDSKEIYVWIEGDHTVVKCVELTDEEEIIQTGKCLHLQFIVMEEKKAVIKVSHYEEPKILVPALASFDEKEIMRLAYDIGDALLAAHKDNLIHRDIKLENLLYDVEQKKYKLGDFGVAKVSEDGMASTVAFTRGYGAPEVVGTLEDKYDCTADIYSFGMVLYVLLNELRFPASNNYRYNATQYIRGFCPEPPVLGSDELCDIVLKMISYDPDERYQSIEEVLNEFDKLKYGRRIKYQREHKNSSLVLGAAFAFAGAFLWTYSFGLNREISTNIWLYIFGALCLGKWISVIFEKKILEYNLGILGIGIYLLCTSGFSWGKLFLLFLAMALDIPAGIYGGSVLIIGLTSYILKLQIFNIQTDLLGDSQMLCWITILLSSLSVCLLFYHFILEDRSEKITKMYLVKNMYWLGTAAFYGLIIIYALEINMIVSSSDGDILKKVFEEDLIKISYYEPFKLGSFGMIFCLGWIIRENFLVFVERVFAKLEIN